MKFIKENINPKELHLMKMKFNRNQIYESENKSLNCLNSKRKLKINKISKIQNISDKYQSFKKLLIF